MDFINKAWTQIVDVVKGLTPGTRIAVGALAAAVVVGLFYLFQYQATGSNEFLLGGRPFVAEELTKAEAAFAKAGLTQWEVVEGSRIKVPQGKKSLFLAALGESDALPADFYNYLDKAAASDNPFSSRGSNDFRRATAKQRELALIISRMRGIAAATVHYDEATKGGPRGDKFKTAMVAVKPLTGELDADQVKAIRSIVASAYAGLKKDDIGITDMNGGQTFGGGGSEGGGSADESLFANVKRESERSFRQKISNQLSYIPGAIVNVNVELNDELQNISQEVKLDTKPITVETSTTTKESVNKSGGTGGRPGADSNGVVQGNKTLTLSQEGTGSESTSNETLEKSRNQPGYKSSHVAKAPLVPTKVTTAIQIPASYFVNVWKQRNPVVAGQPVKDPDPAQIDQIKQTVLKSIEDQVRNLIPTVQQGTNQYPYITVQSYDDIPAAPIAPPTLFAQILDYAGESWRTLGMIAVGLVSLVMLRGMVRGTRSEPAPAPAVQAPQIMEEPEEEEEEPEVETVLRRKFSAGGPNLKQELQLLVKEDPDAAAAILRNWIGDAA